MIDVPPEAVYDHAACKEPGVDPSWFFPERYDRAGTAPAREVCARCQVRDECERWARKAGPWLDGIWAGTTPSERGRHGQRKPRDRRPTAEAVWPPHGTVSRYSNHGCRCGECTAAQSEANRAYKRRKRAEGLPPGDPRHGANTSGYGLYGCRCPECRAAAGRSARPAAVCATRGGYLAHLRNGEKPCDACRQAERDYKAEYRRRTA